MKAYVAYVLLINTTKPKPTIDSPFLTERNQSPFTVFDKDILTPVFNLGPLNLFRKSAPLLQDQHLLKQCLYENDLGIKPLLLILFYIFATESIFLNVLVVTLLNCDPVQPYSIRLSGPTLKTGVSNAIYYFFNFFFLCDSLIKIYGHALSSNDHNALPPTTFYDC